ncbi:glutathione S-transferase S1-like [Nasonia vitripennis]|uniref:glutathione transferase n=1 Tax=Nasonia vitripennis TaxID=7425 RepID=A0A7M7TEG0_NASVI|nr:glutathione S-transferase S1-like [Nasonia vitripennis]
MPMEQVPVLEIDGVKFHQHTSICRYIANKFNLCGANGEESLEIDAIVNDINDMRIEIANYYKEEDPNFKTKLEQKLLEKLPFFLNKFESRVLENNGYHGQTFITLE